MRLIDTDKLPYEKMEISATSKEWCVRLSDIESAPTVDAEPVRHAKWIYLYESSDINRCSLCDFLVQDKISNVREMFNYCPNCGAKMDGELSECHTM